MKILFLTIVVFSIIVSYAEDNKGFRVDGSLSEAERQNNESNFILSLAQPWDWNWFEIDKPYVWVFVNESDLNRPVPHKRLIPHLYRSRNLQNQILVLYEYDFVALTNAIVTSKLKKNNIVVRVPPCFSREKPDDLAYARFFRDKMTSLGFTNVWFQRALGQGNFPFCPFADEDKK